MTTEPTGDSRPGKNEELSSGQLLQGRLFEQAGAAFFGLVGGYSIYGGLHLPVFSDLGAGPGFFPVVIGVVMSALSLTWFITVFRRSTTIKLPEIPGRVGQRQIGATIAAIIVFGVLLPIIGFRLAMALCLFAIMWSVRARLLTSLATSILCAVGIYELFRLLDFPLPHIVSW